MGMPDEIGVGLALLVLLVTVGAFNRLFFAPTSLVQLIANSVFFGLLALGTVFLLSLGETDVSIGWNFNFSAVIAAQLKLFGSNPWIAPFGGLAFGAGLGFFNGMLVVGLLLPAVIVTLGTLSLFQGLSLVVTQSRAIIPPNLSDSYFEFTRFRLFGRLPFSQNPLKAPPLPAPS